MDSENEIVEELIIRDVETMKVIADGLRLKLVKAMQQPITDKAIAAELNMPPSKLYYHVNMMEKHGLIRVVGVNLESGIVEKQYQVTARRFMVQNPILMGEGLARETAVSLWATMLDETKEDFLQAYNLRDESTQPPRYPFATKKAFHLTDEHLTEFHAKLDALIKETDRLVTINQETNGEPFELTVIFYKQVEENK
jgi:DNA-binding Lrp family transcriptional regulator